MRNLPRDIVLLFLLFSATAMSGLDRVSMAFDAIDRWQSEALNKLVGTGAVTNVEFRRGLSELYGQKFKEIEKVLQKVASGVLDREAAVKSIKDHRKAILERYCSVLNFDDLIRRLGDCGCLVKGGKSLIEEKSECVKKLENAMVSYADEINSGFSQSVVDQFMADSQVDAYLAESMPEQSFDEMFSKILNYLSEGLKSTLSSGE